MTATDDVLIIRQLGRQGYEPVWLKMQAMTDTRDDTVTDEIWLVEHDPVFTQGQAGKAEHILMPGDIPVVQVDRGGQVTYHGPGQLVAYLLLDLRRLGLGVRQFVSLIETSLITLLSQFGLSAATRPRAPGVYIDGEKIAALGLRVRSGCCYHGLSLNVDMDLDPFSRINPCGFSDLRVTSLKAQGLTVTVDEAADALQVILLATLATSATGKI